MADKKDKRDYGPDEPVIVSKQCKVMNLYPDTYHYCACGRTDDEPFCDGSHSETSLKPKRFKISEPTTVTICLCRHSKTLPYCDGTHTRI